MGPRARSFVSLELSRIRRILGLKLAASAPPTGWPTKGPRLIVALAADYGNLGDVALTEAALQMGRVALPGHLPWLLTARNSFAQIKGVAEAAGEDDVVLIIGGGNMGNRYPRLEHARCEIIRRFSRQRILSLPQSWDFSGPRAAMDMDRTRSAYASHPRLVIYARDAVSFESMRGALGDRDIRLAPDCAHFLKVADSPISGSLALLRRDGESRLGEDGRAELLGRLRAIYPDMECHDTEQDVPPGYPAHREALVNLLPLVSSAGLVVTDRLHGLLFALIHGRRCVAIDNINQKIAAYVSSWLPKEPSVALVTDPTMAPTAASRLSGDSLRAAERLREGLNPVIDAIANG